MGNEMKYLETESEKFPFIYTLNVMESIQKEYGSLSNWSDLVESKTSIEPDIKALLFFFKESINEGIEIENENLQVPRALIDSKKVGRIITEIGLVNAGNKLKEMVVASTKTDDQEQTGDETKN